MSNITLRSNFFGNAIFVASMESFMTGSAADLVGQLRQRRSATTEGSRALYLNANCTTTLLKTVASAE